MFLGEGDRALRSSETVSGSDRKHPSYTSCHGSFNARVPIRIKRF
jgi:hypothetical protein